MCVSGTARNATMGAELSSKDGRVICIEGMQQWPDKVSGKLVCVTGIIAGEVIAPEGTQAADSSKAQSSGGSSGSMVQDVVAWELVPKALKNEDKHGDGWRKTMQTSRNPIKAPANYKSLQPQGGFKDAGDLDNEWAGSGSPTKHRCEQCGNQVGNLQIYCKEGTSYPNCNTWDFWEVECGGCGMYSYVTTFRAG
jgi:hypothetical protein